MLAIGLFVLGIISRLVLHIPNFTPVIALALFGGFYLKRQYAILLSVGLMVITDVFLGLHNTVLFTWGSMALIASLGFWARERKGTATVVATSLISAILFFVITNFGVWIVSGMYPHTFAGLTTCYVLAIPFFRNMLLSTVVYSLLFFGAYEMIASRISGTKLAPIVL